MAKLTKKQIDKAFDEVTKEHREAGGAIIRMGGDKEDYKKLYNKLKGYSK